MDNKGQVIDFSFLTGKETNKAKLINVLAGKPENISFVLKGIKDNFDCQENTMFNFCTGSYLSKKICIIENAECNVHYSKYFDGISRLFHYSRVHNIQLFVYTQSMEFINSFNLTQGNLCEFSQFITITGQPKNNCIGFNFLDAQQLRDKILRCSHVIRG